VTTAVDTPMLDVRGLEVRYGPILAVQDVTLRVGRGEIVALLGANGAGKSSVLNAVAGLVPAAAGEVELDGASIARRPPEGIVRHGVALSPEGRRVFPRLSVEQNLRLGAAIVKDAGDRAVARERVLDLFPILRERLDQSAGTLSGGQQQMLAIGRALMSLPRLLLLDEPSLGLAPIIVGQIFDLLAGLREDGVTILLVEQNVRRSLEIADRAYILVNGRIESQGDAGAYLGRSDLEAAYLGIEGSE
jgi:branched-chain amino acid transport system ATP-binding protein